MSPHIFAIHLPYYILLDIISICIAIYIAAMSDPELVLKDRPDPFRSWVLCIAKIKKSLLPYLNPLFGDLL